MPTELSDFITWSWKVLVVQGIVAIVLGIVALVWPAVTITVIVVLWGVWALLDGIGMAAAALRPGPTGRRILFGVMALVSIVAAFFAFFRPGTTAAALVWVIGIWLIVRGIFELVGAFSSTTQTPRWLLVVSALLDLVLGILFVARPAASLVSLVWVIGILAIVWGIVFIVIALVVRKNGDRIAAELSAA